MNGAKLAEANLTMAVLTRTNLTSATQTEATLTGVTWGDTTCPDGTNINNDSDTCVNDLGSPPTARVNIDRPSRSLLLGSPTIARS